MHKNQTSASQSRVSRGNVGCWGALGESISFACELELPAAVNLSALGS